MSCEVEMVVRIGLRLWLKPLLAILIQMAGVAARVRDARMLACFERLIENIVMRGIYVARID